MNGTPVCSISIISIVLEAEGQRARTGMVVSELSTDAQRRVQVCRSAMAEGEVPGGCPFGEARCQNESAVRRRTSRSGWGRGLDSPPPSLFALLSPLSWRLAPLLADDRAACVHDRLLATMPSAEDQISALSVESLDPSPDTITSASALRHISLIVY